MFLPTTIQEIENLGWDRPDIILISGDTYIDSPYDGIAVIGKYLMSNGFKTAVIAQPDVSDTGGISRLGEPMLFWGVSAGCVDSMVANYTALQKKKRSDDLTPGGSNNKRPDRASIVYTNLIKQAFKNTVPIVLGGIEASLRRIAHYDYMQDKIRRSILLDAKADYLIYGEGEKAVLQLAERLWDKKRGASGSEGVSECVIEDIRGLCYVSSEKKDGYLELPSFEEVKNDKKSFNEMFSAFYKNNDPISAKGLQQAYQKRFLIQNPPQPYLEGAELDKIFALDFEWDAHPFYKKYGRIKALETIKYSVISHRGCYGECNFCAIAVHQGRRIRSRSEKSILSEVKNFTKRFDFNGIIKDVGGAAANMYGNECKIMSEKGACRAKRCVFPEVCNKMDINHGRLARLLKKIRATPGVNKVFTGSGVRYDLVLADDKNGRRYLEDLIEHHVSGQLKIAPEHTDEEVLKQMGKPFEAGGILKFREEFYRISEKKGKKQFLTYYFIAAHPGCEEFHMKKLARFMKSELRINSEQIQIFTPSPSTVSTAMYYTGINPLTGEKVFSEKNLSKKRRQKEILK